MTPKERQNRAYLMRVWKRRNEACLGGDNLELIDTTDYRDLFDAIKPDTSDLDPSFYLSERLR